MLLGGNTTTTKAAQWSHNFFERDLRNWYIFVDNLNFQSTYTQDFLLELDSGYLIKNICNL